MKRKINWLAILILSAACSKESAHVASASSSTGVQSARAPDIIAVITAIDTGEVWVKSQRADSTTNKLGDGIPEAILRGFAEHVGGRAFNVGCNVRVWFDYSLPVIDTKPQIIAAESVEVVRCKN